MLASLDDVKLHLRATSPDDDPLITSYIEQSQAIIEQRAHRIFEATSNTIRYFDAIEDVDGYTLHLDRDLCAINTVTNGDGVVVTSGQYVTEPRSSTPWHALRLLASSGVAWVYEDDPENAIAISGKWAYSTTPPADIVLATVWLTAWLYRQSIGEGEGDRPFVSADGKVIMPSALPRKVQTILDHYERL